MAVSKTSRPPVRTVLRDGLVHVPVGQQYVGYVLAVSDVEEKGDEMVIRFRILVKPTKHNTGA